MGPPEPIPAFDLYAELGVSASASPAVIDAAWRALVKRHHPDALTADADPAVAARRIRRLNVAHDWLADPERRARYDRERALRPHFGQGRRAAASPMRGATAAEQRAPPPEWRSPPPGWTRGEVRWTRRQPPPPSPPTQPLRLSRAAMVALATVVGVVVIGGALTLIGLAGSGGTSVETIPTEAVAAAADLEDTIPDQVDGLVLLGESSAGLEVFGTDTAGVEQLVARAGGRPEDASAAFKSGSTPDGATALSIIALSLESVRGDQLAAEFRQMTDEDPNSQLSWSDASVGGRRIAVSRDPEDPDAAAYLLSSGAAMYLVVASDQDLADAAIRQLP